MKATHCLGSALAAALIAMTDPASAQLVISRFSIDGGGATQALGGVFTLGGTIGQPDAGRQTGSTFSLNGGFWFGGMGVTAVEDEVPGPGTPTVPAVFRVHPASPNPFADRTIVTFDLPEPAVVRAALYDVSGRLLRILVDEPIPAGAHQRAWDRRDRSGRSVSPGIYFLRLQAGSHRSTQKIVVIQ